MSMTALIILSAIVLLSCTILKRVSARIGVPTLLLFILLGMVFGSDGLVNIPFDDYAFAEKLSMVALAIIMFYGGFGTSWKAAKPVAVVSIVLSSLGTIATAATCRHVRIRSSCSSSATIVTSSPTAARACRKGISSSLLSTKTPSTQGAKLPSTPCLAERSLYGFLACDQCLGRKPFVFIRKKLFISHRGDDPNETRAFLLREQNLLCHQSARQECAGLFDTRH